METDKEYAIRLAMEYGFTGGFDALGNLTFDVTVVEAILEAIQHEREACAKVCESLPTVGELRQLERATMKDCAYVIRARGEAT